MQIPREDEYPLFPPVAGESTTVTPTTTGTWRGELQRMSAPSRMQLGQPMSDQDVRNALDAALTFAGGDITLNMSQLGADEWLRKLGQQEAGEAREGLRYALRASNRAPERGPQDVPTRADLVRAAAGAPSKFKQRLSTWLEGEAADPESAFSRSLKAEKAPPPAKPKRGLLDVFKSKSSPEPYGGGESWTNAVERGRLAKKWKDFTFRRDMKQLGWTEKDLEGVSPFRVMHIWNTKTPNTGQAWRYRAIEEGRQAELARRAAANQEGVNLTAQAKYLNDLRDQAVREALDYPLEEVRPGETYPLAPKK